MSSTFGWAVVTGASSGIGAALVQDLKSRGLPVVLEVARRCTPAIDLSEDDAVRAVTQRLELLQPKGPGLLIHNAAVLEPVTSLMNITREEWRQHQRINVEAPLFLTQALLPFLQPGSRVLMISSGAAHKAVSGWGAYCASKAALHRIYTCLRVELEPKQIHVGSVRPGVVDTPMQETIRGFDAETFADVEKFQKLYSEGQLESCDDVANFIAWLLLDVESSQFSAEEWDIRNENQGWTRPSRASS